MRPATEDLKNKLPGEGRCKGSSERTAHHLAGTEVQCSGRAVRARLIPNCTCLIYHPHALQKNSQLQAPLRQRWSPQERVSPGIQKEESWCHYSDYLCQCQGDNSRAPCSCLSCWAVLFPQDSVRACGDHTWRQAEEKASCPFLSGILSFWHHHFQEEDPRGEFFFFLI